MNVSLPDLGCIVHDGIKFTKVTDGFLDEIFGHIFLSQILKNKHGLIGLEFC